MGSRVLVRNVAERGRPGKIHSYWEENIYVIKSQKGEDSPVFEVEPESDRGRTRILHRNMLLPCDFFQSLLREITRAKKRNIQIRQQATTEHIQRTDVKDSDDDFSEVTLTWPQTEYQS